MLDYSLKRSTAPSIEPISLSDLKNALRVEHNDDDTELTNLIEVGRLKVERDTGRSLITQSWQLKLDGWQWHSIELLQPPTQSVTSITYVDTAGDVQTWASSNYDVDTDSQPGLVRLAYLKTYPSLRGDARGVVVTYVAGYGDAASDVPYDLRQAVILAARMLYDGDDAGVASAYESLVAGNITGVLPG